MEYENNYASKGVAGAGLGLGIAGTALGLMAGNGGFNLFGNNCNNGCHENTAVNRYELAMQNEIASKDSKIALLESNIFVDSKIADVYEKLNTKISGLESQLCQQAVKNAQIEGTFAVLGEQHQAMRNEFMCALKREKDERCCGDNSIVNYANATFYPKLVANVTAGTETTAQTVYNPLPNCGCGY